MVIENLQDNKSTNLFGIAALRQTFQHWILLDKLQINGVCQQGILYTLKLHSRYQEGLFFYWGTKINQY